MAKIKIIAPQLKVRNNLTGDVHDVPETVWKGYTKDYLYDEDSKPKFTIMETAEAFMTRIKNAPPLEKPPAKIPGSRRR